MQAALLELIDTVAGFPIDQDRLYLTGLSMGGIGSFDILPKYPDKFAGALLIAATGDASRMPLMVDVPLWATHSVDDPTVNYTTGTLALINALEAAGALVTRGEWRATWPTARPRPRRCACGRRPTPTTATRCSRRSRRHHPGQRALVVGADLPQRRDARLALQQDLQERTPISGAALLSAAR